MATQRDNWLPSETWLCEAWTPTEIATKLNVAPATVYTRKIKAEGRIERWLGSGSKPKLDPEAVKEVKADGAFEKPEATCQGFQCHGNDDDKNSQEGWWEVLGQIGEASSHARDQTGQSGIIPDGNFILQRDGTTAHRSKTIQDLLRHNVLFWPKLMWSPVQTGPEPVGLHFVAALRGDGLPYLPP